MTNLPDIDLDFLNEAADRLEDNARELVREVRALRKRAKVLRRSAATLRGLEPGSALDPTDNEEEEL